MEHHLPKLIVDLALILGAGAIMSIIFKKIKQPVVLGYIIAGFIVGPYFNIAPTVVDKENVKIWADLGVIFLLFSLGLEFSFKKLIKVGASASITAIVKIIAILILGYYVGQWMGWSRLSSLFLGGILASSSTTIILRAFDELQVKHRSFAKTAFGVLIVEDIVVILLLVLLPIVAYRSSGFPVKEVFGTLGKLGFFMILWFLAGIYLVPTLLRKAKVFLDKEILLILSIGMCLGMALLATEIGFSAELGAFVMGSILAETLFAEKIENINMSVKNLFGAIFFISIGMKINPQEMIEYAWPIFFITLLTIFGKLITTVVGALISGQTLKHSIQVGMSMAQIGEFAFIVAGIVQIIDPHSAFLFPVAVGVSVITTFTTPYMIKSADKVYELTERVLPSKFFDLLHKYSEGIKLSKGNNMWNKLLLSYAILVVVNGILVIGIAMISNEVVQKYIAPRLKEYTSIGEFGSMVITLILCSPFFWAIMKKKVAKDTYNTIWDRNKYSKWPLLLLEGTRYIVVIVLIGIVLDKFYSGVAASVFVIPIVIVVIYLLSKKYSVFYKGMSNRFIYNLHERDSIDDENKIV